MSDIHVVLIGGPAGVGKSTLARKLGEQTHFALVDKDTVGGPLVGKMNEIYGLARDNRSHQFYLDHGRPSEYQSTMDVLMDNIAIGNSVIAVAPFGPEFRNPEWLPQLQLACEAARPDDQVRIHKVAVVISDAAHEARIRQRASPRDGDKLVDFPEWLARNRGAAPLPPVYTLDVSEDKATEKHAQQLIDHLSLTQYRAASPMQQLEDLIPRGFRVILERTLTN